MAHIVSLPSTILIANRGEIAIRVARTCKALGIRSVAVHSVADRTAPHVKACDHAVELSGPSPVAGYLDGDQIIAAAQLAQAEAVHPGYGFLSENAGFARACGDSGLIFIGPAHGVIRQLGDKIAAKEIAVAAGVPTVPGIVDSDQVDVSASTDRDELLLTAARDMTFPLLVKASAGGGGRGMRIVVGVDELPRAIKTARREAKAAFGNDRLLVERYIVNPRHIEVQIFGDQHGGALHLYERDCSVQRRHQKIVEEAPAPGLKAETRIALHEAALSLARAVNYDNAGTVEFILDAETEEFFFLEVNTRLQVEHPVTEAILGLDLVDWQIRVAAGEELPLAQSQLIPDGSAIEVRIAAEDARRNFLPQTGHIARVVAPRGEGIRFDSGIEDDYTVTPFYDSMLAKVIAHGPDRETAIRRLDRALATSSIMGIKTNAQFLREVLQNDDFAGAKHTTHLAAQMLESGVQQLPAADNKEEFDVAAAILTVVVSQRSAMHSAPWASLGAWRGGRQAPWKPRAAYVLFDESKKRHAYWVRVADGVAEFEPIGADSAKTGEVTFSVAGDRLVVRIGDDVRSYLTYLDRGFSAGVRVHIDDGRGARAFTYNDSLAAWRNEVAAADRNDGQIRAPGPGMVVSVSAEIGDKVVAGSALVVVESMKMLQTLTAPRDGEVASISCEEGQAITKGEVLVELKLANSGTRD